MIDRLRQRWLNILLLLIIGIALVLFIDLKRVGAAIASIPLDTLIIVFFISTLDRFFMGYKWRHLILAAGGKLKLHHAISAYYQSGLGSRLLPVPLSSELLRAHIICMAGVPSSIVFGSMAMEKMLAFLSSFLLGLVGLIYLLPVFHTDFRDIVLFSMLAGILVGSIALVFSLWHSAHKLAGKVFDKYLPRKIITPLQQFSKAILSYRSQRKVIAANIVMVFAEQVLIFTKFFFLGRALNIDVPFITFFAIISVTIVVRRAASLIDGLGLGEIGSVIMFVILGIDRETAVTLIIMNYAVSFIASIPGVYLLYRSGLNIKSLVGRERTYLKRNDVSR